MALTSQPNDHRDSRGEPPPVVNQPYRFWGGFATDVREAYLQRELLQSLIVREMRKRYKGTFLGWGWALIRPLVMLAVYGIAVGVILGAGAQIPEFAVYLYVGLIAWAFFSTVISGSINSLPDNAALIGKASFRRELLIVAVVTVAVIDLLLQASVLVIAYWLYGSWPSMSTLWWVIPGLIVLVLVAVGIGLLLSALNVYFRDIGYLVDVALQVGFWSVPILYSYEMVASLLESQTWLLTLYTANPPLAAINAFRFALWPSAWDPNGSAQLLGVTETSIFLLVSATLGVVLVWIGQRTFSRMAGNIAQEL